MVLGLLAITATLEPLVAPFVSKKLSETEFHFKVLKIPVLLKVWQLERAGPRCPLRGSSLPSPCAVDAVGPENTGAGAWAAQSPRRTGSPHPLLPPPLFPPRRQSPPSTADTRNPQDGLEFSFTLLELLLSAGAALFSAWYLRDRHWFASNVLGLAFSLQGIEHLSLGSVSVGAILLSGLFFYDIFWVFFTPVMVSVAKNFDAPIKLLFPRFSLDGGRAVGAVLGGTGRGRPGAACTAMGVSEGWLMPPWGETCRNRPAMHHSSWRSCCSTIPSADSLRPRHASRALLPHNADAGNQQFSMLGLGDIVIPGIFVAIVLRYDVAHGHQTRFFARSAWQGGGGAASRRRAPVPPPVDGRSRRASGHCAHARSGPAPTDRCPTPTTPCAAASWAM